MEHTLKIIRPAKLAEMLDVSTVTIWRMEKRGDLPPKKKISSGITGWLEADLAEWLGNLPNASSKKDLEGIEK